MSEFEHATEKQKHNLNPSPANETGGALPRLKAGLPALQNDWSRTPTKRNQEKSHLSLFSTFDDMLIYRVVAVMSFLPSAVLVQLNSVEQYRQ